MSRPLLLDLFCGAGGAAMGYHRAGFDVVGVDINPQPRYPFTFHQGDALTFPLDGFDAVHASPPCPAYSRISDVHGVHEGHPDLIGAVRNRLRGRMYVIENVPRAPLFDPVTLCGSMFRLGAVCRDGVYRQLRRHRLFEVSGLLIMAPRCAHRGEPIGVYGHGGGQVKTARSGRGVNRGYMGLRSERGLALDIDWMLHRELTDAIPPAYTECIGVQLLQAMGVTAQAVSA